MFLQRNTTSQTFTLPGTLRAIADGSAVTSGATLTWIKDGTSAASAGTLTHVSDGAYTYQPTQAETDAKICGWILSKTGAAGISGSVRTTNADPNDGTRLGQTALPNANAGATGGVAVLDANGNVAANTTRLANQTVTAAAGVTFPASVGTSTLTQAQVTGGAYAILTDSSGRVVLEPSEHTTIAGDVQSGLTAQGYTATRAAKLDDLDATVSSRMATFSVPANFGNLLIDAATGLVGSHLREEMSQVLYREDMSRLPIGSTPTGWVQISGAAALQVAILSASTTTDGKGGGGGGARALVPATKTNLALNVFTNVTPLVNQTTRGACVTHVIAGATDTLALAGRVSADGNNLYTVFPIWNSPTAQCWKRSSGTYTQVGANIAIPAFAENDIVNQRLDVIGTAPVTIGYKVWLKGQDEPAAYTASWTDSTSPVTAAGYFGLILIDEPGTAQPNASDLWFGEPTAQWKEPAEYQVINTGNSIAAGYLNTVSPSTYEADYLGAKFIVHNLGVTSQTTTTMIANDPAKISRLLNPGVLKTVVVGQEILNDYLGPAGKNWQTAVANWVTYCQTIRALGVPVITIPVMPVPSADMPEGDRTQINNYFAQNWPNFCDGYVSGLLSNSNLGGAGANTNATYYQSDQVHWKDPANQQAGVIEGLAVLQLFGGSAFTINADTTTSKVVGLVGVPTNGTLAADNQSESATLASINSTVGVTSSNAASIKLQTDKLLFDGSSYVKSDPQVDSPGTTTLLSRLTSARAGYLDNLNVGGAVASHADILAINQSASKHLLLVTVAQYEPGETYTIEMRTFAAADGSAVNADTTPTLTATGQVSGSLSANLSAATNPATGVYRWTYTPGAAPTLEQIRFDGSATINSSPFTISTYSQTVDEATAVFTATDQAHLTSIYNKLPSGNIGDATAANQTTILAQTNKLQFDGSNNVKSTPQTDTPGTTTLLSRLGAPAGASIAADIASVKTDTTTLLNRLGAWTGSGINTVLGAFRAVVNKLVGLTPTDLTSGGGTFSNTADSLEAIASNSGSGGGTILHTGTAQGGTSSTITLDSGASATNNLYSNCIVALTGGTGAGQSAIITGYTGSTKVTTINGTWAINPDATTTFNILPLGSIPGATAPTASQVASAVWTFVGRSLDTTVPVGPSSAIVQTANLAATSGGMSISLSLFQSTNTTLKFKIVDLSGNSIDLTNHVVDFLIHAVGSSTATTTIVGTLSASDPTGHPTVLDTVTIVVGTSATATAGNFAYKLRDTTAQAIYASGNFNVLVSP